MTHQTGDGYPIFPDIVATLRHWAPALRKVSGISMTFEGLDLETLLELKTFDPGPLGTDNGDIPTNQRLYAANFAELGNLTLFQLTIEFNLSGGGQGPKVMFFRPPTPARIPANRSLMANPTFPICPGAGNIIAQGSDVETALVNVNQATRFGVRRTGGNTWNKQNDRLIEIWGVYIKE